MDQEETKFLNDLTIIIESHLSDENFGVDHLAKAYGTSRSQLHRRLKNSTGYSVGKYILKIRLEHAKRLLEEGELTVSEVAYQIGFTSVSYFSKCFKRYYGHTPSATNRTPGSLTSRKDMTLHSFSDSLIGYIKEKGPWTDFFTKNNKVAVTLYSIIAIVLFAVFFFIINKSADPIIASAEKTIAIIPFENKDPDSANDYFCEGITESISHQLSSIKDLRVISRAAVEQYNVAEMSLAETSKKLGAKTVLTGSVNKSAARIQISIQLLDAENGSTMWSDSYKCDLDKSIFEVQNRIVRMIANKLDASITTYETSLLNKSLSFDPKAFDYYLKGVKWFNTYKSTGDRAHLDKAEQYFNTALSISPDYPNTYVGLAKVQNEKGNQELMFNFASKSVEVDPLFAEGHELMGRYYYMKKDGIKAELCLTKSIDIKPGGLAYLYLGLTYIDLLNEPKKGIKYINEEETHLAIKKDEELLLSFILVYLGIGDYSTAQKYIAKLPLCEMEFMHNAVLVLDNNQEALRSFSSGEEGSSMCKPIAALNQFSISFINQDYEKCVDAYHTWKSYELGLPGLLDLNLDLNWYYVTRSLGYGNKYTYLLDEVQEKAEQLLYEGNGTASYLMARISALKNEHNKALFYLKEYEKYGFRNGHHDFLRIDPIFEGLATRDEFVNLVDRVQKEKLQLRREIGKV